MTNTFTKYTAVVMAVLMLVSGCARPIVSNKIIENQVSMFKTTLLTNLYNQVNWIEVASNMQRMLNQGVRNSMTARYVVENLDEIYDSQSIQQVLSNALIEHGIEATNSYPSPFSNEAKNKLFDVLGDQTDGLIFDLDVTSAVLSYLLSTQITDLLNVEDQNHLSMVINLMSNDDSLVMKIQSLKNSKINSNLSPKYNLAVEELINSLEFYKNDNHNLVQKDILGLSALDMIGVIEDGSGDTTNIIILILILLLLLFWLWPVDLQ